MTTVEVRDSINDEGEADAEWTHIRDLLGVSMLNPISVGIGPLEKHCGFVDDSGLLEQRAGYILCPSLYPLPLAGNVLLIGEVRSQFGIVCQSSPLNEDVVRQLFDNAYVSRKYAKAAHDLAEIKAIRRTPNAIVVRVSGEM